MFNKILIANRGEIACRVAATARRMAVKTVAVYSDADAHAKHVAACDEAVHIGGSAPRDSYLRWEKIIEAAKATGAQAIHPGYGFLSENAAFAQACVDAGLVFVGPPASAIEAMVAEREVGGPFTSLFNFCARVDKGRVNKRVVEALIKATGIDFRIGGNRAFYVPSLDYVQVPPPQAYFEPINWHRTALHELGHASGHASRLGRDLTGGFGTKKYAFEELVAEMGSAFLSSHCGLQGQLHHASYIASWLEALRNDKRLVFSAASLAQKAVDFLMPELAAPVAASQAEDAA